MNAAFASSSNKPLFGKKISLDESFVPTAGHVVCGRGGQAFSHNEHFRARVAELVDQYASASSKALKSALVTQVYDEVMETGGFVRQDSKTKKWFTVSEAAAREKITQLFRDSLGGRYQPSKDCKSNKRNQDQSSEAAVPSLVASLSPSTSAASQDEQCVNAPALAAPKKKRRVSFKKIMNLSTKKIKTEDALRNLMMFATSVTGGSAADSNTSSYNNEEESSQDIFEKFHPITSPATKRCSFTEIDFNFESEEFAFSALSAV